MTVSFCMWALFLLLIHWPCCFLNFPGYHAHNCICLDQDNKISNATQLSIATWYNISRQFRDILELCYIIVKFIHPLQQSAIGPRQPYNYPLTPYTSHAGLHNHLQLFLHCSVQFWKHWIFQFIVIEINVVSSSFSAAASSDSHNIATMWGLSPIIGAFQSFHTVVVGWGWGKPSCEHTWALWLVWHWSPSSDYQPPLTCFSRTKLFASQ